MIVVEGRFAFPSRVRSHLLVRIPSEHRQVILGAAQVLDGQLRRVRVLRRVPSRTPAGDGRAPGRVAGSAGVGTIFHLRVMQNVFIEIGGKWLIR